MWGIFQLKCAVGVVAIAMSSVIARTDDLDRYRSMSVYQVKYLLYIPSRLGNSASDWEYVYNTGHHRSLR
jgi:hypothetical protein